jgi:hypothetical protein
MADRRPNYSDTGEGTGGRGIPRWLRPVGIAVAILVLLAVAVMLMSGGHTPPPGVH